ncbi:uncharacterized protein BO80DRAFT_449439 [Aspergillus ibericus CBS 121593]|uniref:Uncharacterized protein n=1 Tax=Aspergillus ibericus CBS 121593 TaxID=1448316 RepID=A0A395GL56_9EURO|nr:hypothetical protein BO80DRAFT_449439 [Aspergillus ibericus CBS 121593]RAK96241.1 hypothetical protein BO80DRAFT_449439 [Aspergillus ibericus CBS 121593]
MSRRIRPQPSSGPDTDSNPDLTIDLTPSSPSPSPPGQPGQPQQPQLDDLLYRHRSPRPIIESDSESNRNSPTSTHFPSPAVTPPGMYLSRILDPADSPTNSRVDGTTAAQTTGTTQRTGSADTPASRIADTQRSGHGEQQGAQPSPSFRRGMRRRARTPRDWVWRDGGLINRRTNRPVFHWDESMDGSSEVEVEVEGEEEEESTESDRNGDRGRSLERSWDDLGDIIDR